MKQGANRDGIAMIGAAKAGKAYKHLVSGGPIEITPASTVRFQVSGILDLAPIDVEVPIALMQGVIGLWLEQVAVQNGIKLRGEVAR
jgi:hypothetical protein